MAYGFCRNCREWKIGSLLQNGTFQCNSCNEVTIEQHKAQRYTFSIYMNDDYNAILNSINDVLYADFGLRIVETNIDAEKGKIDYIIIKV
jgi:hypothetical protein